MEGFSSQEDHHSDDVPESESSEDEVRDEKLIYFYDPKDNLEHGNSTFCFACSFVCLCSDLITNFPRHSHKNRNQNAHKSTGCNGIIISTLR